MKSPKDIYTLTLLKKLILLILLGVFIASLTRPHSKLVKFSEAQSLMASIIKIDVCAEPAQKARVKEAFQDVWKRLEDISWRMNVFDERSDVAKVNSAYPDPVPIGADTYEVLKEAIRFNQISLGAFDITIWPLCQLWKEAEEKNVFPSLERIKTAQRLVGIDKVKLLENNQVKLAQDGTRIDLGGIAAGYVVDEAVRIFRGYEIRNFLIDAAGDMYAGGLNCEGKPWRVGISDPRDRSKFLGVVALSNAAVTTSGNYEQYFNIQGKSWSHIINPVTGFPQKEVVSATVIGPRTIDADALATAVCVLGREVGTKVIDSLGNLVDHVKMGWTHF